MLFSNHNGSLPRQQPIAMTIGHNTAGKEKAQNFMGSGLFCLVLPVFSLYSTLLDIRVM